MLSRSLVKLFIIIGILMGSLSLSWPVFAKDVTLSKQEAWKLIMNNDKYPKPYSISTRVNTDEKIKKLIAEGFLKNETGNAYGCVYGYPSTKKGENYGIKTCCYTTQRENQCYIDANVCNMTLKEIDEILIDKESKIAIVKYTINLEPLEPIYSLVCIDDGCQFYGNNINSRKEKLKIKLKEYDKGWRVFEE